ncbi:MAG TPA: ECF-type sigma factor [Acidobacteriota bacterium]|nr:ECF-type sigma factor [Acidobacteriota bacterium]HMZ78996.1 ECF-type sigma factor [Acidobacteriota bacterium]HNB69807.1 ECF-type sigma factor [Acidobacteriota bacterium]HND19847.1 ECF-type sigma factor [Acidobacteriota bacterium]HNG93072.1 ECF-type sigma factor [Acidobacteriota bacterium]
MNPGHDSGEVTVLLKQWRQEQNADAYNQLIPLVYNELRRIALAISFRQGQANPADQTLNPTAIVQQAYLNLIDQHTVEWNDRAHFLAIAAREMRRILVDHWRYKHAQMRGGELQQVSFADIELAQGQPDFDGMALHRALEKLANLDPEEAQIVDLRYFGGLTVDEVAEVLQLSRATIERRERHAKAWIRKQLGSEAL